MLILEGVDVTQIRLGVYYHMAEWILRVQIGRQGGTPDVVVLRSTSEHGGIIRYAKD